MFVDLDWPLNASSLLSASAELLVFLLMRPTDRGDVLVNEPSGDSSVGAWHIESSLSFKDDLFESTALQLASSHLFVRRP